MTDKSWIDILVTKREAAYSNVVIVETNDDKRFRELLRYFKAKDRRMLVYDTFAGLSDGYGNAVGDSSKGLSGLLKGDPIDAINKLLTNPSEDSTEEVAIIKNVLESKDVAMKAVNFWTTEDVAFGSGRTLVVFVPDRGLIDQRVLDKCILVVPPLSLPQERKAILAFLCEDTFGAKKGDKVEALKLPQEKTDALVTLTAGLDLNQTEAVFIETLNNYVDAKVLDMGVVSKTKADIIEKSGLLRVMSPKYGFEGVGGYDAVKDYVIEAIIKPLKNPDKARELGVEPPRGAIIFGPPGTGKTIITKAMGFALNYPVIALSPEMFLGSYVGQSERQLRTALKIIEELAPCLVIVDEIDRFGSRGGPQGESDGGVQGRTFSQMLEYLADEDRKAFFVGTTNAPMLDEAFRREGRFDVMIPMMSPDTEARYAIIKIHLDVRRKVKHSITDDKLREVAAATSGWKGNMLEELVKRATRLAFNQDHECVTDQDLQDALDDYKVNKEALLASESKYLELAETLCNSQKFLAALKKAVVMVDGKGREEFLKRKSKRAFP